MTNRIRVQLDVDTAAMHMILQSASVTAHNIQASPTSDWASFQAEQLLETIADLRGRLERAEAEALTH